MGRMTTMTTTTTTPDTRQTIYLVPSTPEWDGEANRVQWIEHDTRPDERHETATWTPDDDGMARYDAIREATRHSPYRRCSACGTIDTDHWHDENSIVRPGQDDPRHYCHDCGTHIESDTLDTDEILAALPEDVDVAVDADGVVVLVADCESRTDEVLAVVRAAEEAKRADCTHDVTRRLYEQRPPSEGRKLVATARMCEDCGALMGLP